MESSRSHGGGSPSSPAPFLIKTYEMVEDPATNNIVSWGPSSASFVVWNPPEFSRDLLPKYFKHNNFSSFIRQLNTYGFRKIDPEQWEFANEDFIRGQTHLLKKIHRRKPVHSHSLLNQVNGSLVESERRELEEEINRLKYEKSVLLADLQRHTQQQYGMNWQMQSLEERLIAMEKRQKNLVASVGQILQGRGLVSSFLLEPEHFSKKRRVPKIGFFDEGPELKEYQMAYLQPTSTERPNIFPMQQPVNAEPFDKMELALVSLEKVFQAANHASREDMYHGATSSGSPSLVLGEIHSPTPSMDTNINLHSPDTLHSSLEQKESPSHAESPVLPLAEIHENCKMAEVDMRSQAATTDTSQDGTVEAVVSNEPTRVNDQFWERFLTETPQSCDVCGAQSERLYLDDKIGVQSDSLHNLNNVDQIIEQMGHLTSAENT